MITSQKVALFEDSLAAINTVAGYDDHLALPFFKVKDAVDTCKRLCISAIEKAKKGVRDADEELKMLKDVLDASEEVTEEEMLEYLNNSSVSEALPSEVKSEILQHVASNGSLGVVFTKVEDIESESVEKIFNEADGKESMKFISGTDLGEEVKNAIKLEKVVLQWIPSHCGIHGNEQADKLAKEALTLHSPCLPMPLRNAKRLLRDKLRQKRISTLTHLAIGKSWSCLLDGQRIAQLSALLRVGHVSL
ncbi:uncharacterized protein TNCV_1582681 [Trichonephila clavipes]|nr:uncharacterized protein TNCV_1582681 [Trichonephila clavipes]